MAATSRRPRPAGRAGQPAGQAEHQRQRQQRPRPGHHQPQQRRDRVVDRAGDGEDRGEDHRQRLPRRPAGGVELEVRHLATPHDPGPRVVRGRRREQQRQRRQRQAGRDQLAHQAARASVPARPGRPCSTVKEARVGHARAGAADVRHDPVVAPPLARVHAAAHVAPLAVGELHVRVVGEQGGQVRALVLAVAATADRGAHELGGHHRRRAGRA